MTRDADASRWWQRAVLYQIYPRSFQDSDGDGVGDLAGITSRLDDLVDLGIDALWLSPVYRSPMVDFGYDVTDHCDIDPLFGTLDDMDALIASAHGRGLRVIMDYVANHTSDQHPWFLESRSSRRSPRREWYVWRDPAPDGGPPTNWRSEFGGSAWTYDDTTGQYYHHGYLAEQPNLNWHHPEVRAAMFDVLQFWIDRGVDGFRLDAFRRLFVDLEFRDDPPNPNYRPGRDPEVASLVPIGTCERPELFDLIAQMRNFVDARGECVLIGEVYVEPEVLARYHGTSESPGLHLAGNFNLLWTPWEPDAIASLIRRYEQSLPAHAWPNWVLGNHDRSRLASRLGDAQARVAAMFLLTARGTPTVYAGDEIGMRDVSIPPESVRDPWELREPGRGLGRDPERTPIPWSAGLGGGFTTGTPWLPMGDDRDERNVAAARADPCSIWHLHRELIELRHREPALAIGAIEAVAVHGGVLSYQRVTDRQRLLIALELRGEAGSVPLPAPIERVVASTDPDRSPDVSDIGHDRSDRMVTVSPNEGLIIELVATA